MDKAAQEQLYINTVVPAIKESGKPLTLIRKGEATNKPFEGYKPGVETPYTGHCIELSATTDGVIETLAKDSLKVIMCTFDDDTLMTEELAPTVGSDKIQVGNNKYSILNVQETKPGEVLFFYTLYLGA